MRSAELTCGGEDSDQEPDPAVGQEQVLQPAGAAAAAATAALQFPGLERRPDSSRQHKRVEDGHRGQTRYVDGHCDCVAAFVVVFFVVACLGSAVMQPSSLMSKKPQ